MFIILFPYFCMLNVVLSVFVTLSVKIKSFLTEAKIQDK